MKEIERYIVFTRFLNLKRGKNLIWKKMKDISKPSMGSELYTVQDVSNIYLLQMNFCTVNIEKKKKRVKEQKFCLQASFR